VVTARHTAVAAPRSAPLAVPATAPRRTLRLPEAADLLEARTLARRDLRLASFRVLLPQAIGRLGDALSTRGQAIDAVLLLALLPPPERPS
jgi:hypothetical protein